MCACRICMYIVYALWDVSSLFFPQKMAVYLETTFSEDNMTVHSSIISRSKSFEGIKINKLFVS